MILSVWRSSSIMDTARNAPSGQMFLLDPYVSGNRKIIVCILELNSVKINLFLFSTIFFWV